MAKTASARQTGNLVQLLASAVAQGPAPVDWTKIDTQIQFEGQKIVLPSSPENMDYDVAIDTLARIRDQENQEYDVVELVAGAPWDTLVATYRAMQEIYGVVLATSKQSWFGEIKPDFVTVITGHGPQDRLQVPMGQMELPGVSEPIQVTMRGEGTIISGTVRQKDRAILVEIANRARAIINTNSVYKAKAIRLNVDEEGNLQLHSQPEFIDLTAVKETDIIHTDDTAALIQTNIFAPLKHTAACRANKIPLKRGILLEGKYGTGKSLTARVTAKVATDNNWTFILLNRSQGLKAAIEFARQYQPCVIFAEDIDRAADRADEGVNDLVNLLDGVISKSMEMMVVLTTNFIENIDRSLLRPGRFDAVISIDVPDAKTAERIIRSYAGNLLPQTADLFYVGLATEGMIPASIREVVERAKLGMLSEGRSEITSEDLRVSAIGMKRHMALLSPPAEQPSSADLLAKGLLAVMTEAFGPSNDDLATSEQLAKVEKHLCKDVNKVGVAVDATNRSAQAAGGAAMKAKQNIDALAEKIVGKVSDIHEATV